MVAFFAYLAALCIGLTCMVEHLVLMVGGMVLSAAWYGESLYTGVAWCIRPHSMRDSIDIGPPGMVCLTNSMVYSGPLCSMGLFGGTMVSWSTCHGGQHWYWATWYGMLVWYIW